jgi:hypothetical protein
MRLYRCRWENGDFSVVQAESKDHAIEMLDEEANAEGLSLYAIAERIVGISCDNFREFARQGSPTSSDSLCKLQCHKFRHNV